VHMTSLQALLRQSLSEGAYMAAVSVLIKVSLQGYMYRVYSKSRTRTTLQCRVLEWGLS
jgi:hypothetical protein